MIKSMKQEETIISPQAPSRIIFLDGLRGLAILMVVLFHMYPTIFPKGYLGVDVFFVISGYFLFKGYNKNWHCVNKAFG